MPGGEAARGGRKIGRTFDDEPDRLESVGASVKKHGKQREKKDPAGHGENSGRERQHERGGKIRLTP
jgi:hypothetical protein